MERIQLDKKDSGASHKMKHIRIYSEPPKKNNFTETIGGVLLMAVFGIAFFFTLNSSLHKMTVYDCDQGVQAACRELKR